MRNKDLIRLAVALGVLACIFLAAHFIGSRYNPQEKYSHPATRPGAGWKQ